MFQRYLKLKEKKNIKHKNININDDASFMGRNEGKTKENYNFTHNSREQKNRMQKNCRDFQHFFL